GNANSTKCPSADEMMYLSLSKSSPSLWKPPRARARSFATLGFSAMISDLDIETQQLATTGSRSRTRLSEFHEIFSGQLLDQSLQLKGEESRRDCRAWQIAFRRDVIDLRFGCLDRIVNEMFFFRERRQRASRSLR